MKNQTALRVASAFLSVMLGAVASPAAASPWSKCTANILARAPFIKATANDIIRTTEDQLDQRIDKFADQAISDSLRTELLTAKELLEAVRSLQLSPSDAGSKILNDLCKNGLSVQKTVGQ